MPVRVPNFAAIVSARPTTVGPPASVGIAQGLAAGFTNLSEGISEADMTRKSLTDLAALTDDPKERATYLAMADSTPSVMTPGKSPAGALFADRLKTLEQEKQQKAVLANHLALQNNQLQNQITMAGINNALLTAREQNAAKLRLDASTELNRQKAVLETLKAQLHESDDATKNAKIQADMAMQEKRIQQAQDRLDQAERFHRDTMDSGAESRRMQQEKLDAAKEKQNSTPSPELLMRQKKEWDDLYSGGKFIDSAKVDALKQKHKTEIDLDTAQKKNGGVTGVDSFLNGWKSPSQDTSENSYD